MAESYAAQNFNRLPELIDKTYKKIEELKKILLEESKLLNFDVTPQIQPIERRQEELAKKVSLVTFRIQRNSDKSIVSNQGSFTRGRSLTVGAGCRATTFESSQVQQSKSFKSVGLDVNDGKNPVSKENVEGGSKVSQTRGPAKDMSFYGSLDRNFAKRKKDKHRRHTKVLGSLATLEKTDYIQPDEHYQYEIGLPLNNSTLGIIKSSHKQRPGIPPEFRQGHDNFNTGPALPPKPVPTVKFEPARMGQPKISLLETNHLVYPHPHISLHMPSSPLHAPTTQMEMVVYPQEKEMVISSSKSWFETTLDEPSPVGKSNKFDSPNAFDVNSMVDVGESASMKVQVPSPSATISEKSSKSSECSESKVSFSNEFSKPFEMSDCYKYSTKYRPAAPSPRSPEEIKRLLEEKFKKSSLRTPVVSLDTNGNDMEAPKPKLPPKQKMNNFKLDPAYLDEEAAWVMDTPTIV